MAPSDYYLFRSLQHHLADTHFVRFEEIRKCIDDFIASKPMSFYRQGIRNPKDGSRPRVFDWYKMLKDDRESVENEHQRRPKISTDEQHVKQIKDLVLQNRRLTIRELGDIKHFIWISPDHFERPFVLEKSQISFGSENTQFFGKTASR
ncbi:hypothetical protein P5V15_014724 [Pogonomyrmex californicus]